MRNASVSISQQSLAPATRVTPSTAARTKLLLEGPILTTGLGLGLFYVSQGVGRGVAAMNANAVRMVASAAGGLVAIYWLDLGVVGLFTSVAAGFCLYAAILVYAVSSVSVDRRESSGRPQAASSKRRAHPFARSI
jgi:phage shock protein PspC (stress-responsive transcriptional regulator)